MAASRVEPQVSAFACTGHEAGERRHSHPPKQSRKGSTCPLEHDTPEVRTGHLLGERSNSCTAWHRNEQRPRTTHGQGRRQSRQSAARLCSTRAHRTVAGPDFAEPGRAGQSAGLCPLPKCQFRQRMRPAAIPAIPAGQPFCGTRATLPRCFAFRWLRARVIAPW